MNDIGILAVSVAGAIELAERSDLAEVLAQSIKASGPKAIRFFNDGVIAGYTNVVAAFEGFQKLVALWSDPGERLMASPLMFGVGASLHVGNLEDGWRKNLFGRPADVAMRLIGDYLCEFFRITESAAPLIIDHIKSVDASATPGVVDISPLGQTTAYTLNIRRFLPHNRYRVSLYTPVDLARFLAGNPDELFYVSPRNFEEVIAEVFAAFGYEVELTKATRDNGIDIIAFGKRPGLGLREKLLVQCKRYAPNKKVGIGVVHELLGAGVDQPNTGLVLVTTSRFTSPAKALADKETVRWRLHLRDYDDIRGWLDEYVRLCNHINSGGSGA